MFTNLVHLALRLMAGAAFFVASATVVLTELFSAPLGACAAPRAAPYPTTQQFTVAASISPIPVATYDAVTVVMPPKPKPTPTVTMSSAAAKPRKPEVTHYSTPVGSAQAYAASKVSGGNFDCLVKLWNRESSWNTHAENASSGAYGIPQSLPASQMASAGSDWQDNPRTQINWGLSYINSRYGSACAAWAHSNAFGWY